MTPSKPEVKVLDQNNTYSISNPGTSSSTSANAQVNRWVALFHNPDDPTAPLTYPGFIAASTSGADLDTAVAAYNASVFALTIPQGTKANERLGAEVNVLKDKWKFQLYFNSVNPADTSIPATAHTLNPRQIKIRLVGISQDQLLESGNIGYRSVEMFSEQDERLSHFKRGDAQGYSVVYDKTRTMTLFEPNADNAARSFGSGQITFAANFSYRRTYSVRADDAVAGTIYEGNIAGTEITNQTGATGVVIGGTQKGQILWYYFIEDLYPPNYTATGVWRYPQFGYGCKIDRRTYWSDA